MEFDAVLAQVLYLLQQEGSVSYRALKLRFQLSDTLKRSKTKSSRSNSKL